MLTRKYILQVARLLDQTGEPRPGYQDEMANFKGHDPFVDFSFNNAVPKENNAEESAILSLALDYEEDPRTGDVRIVRRQSVVPDENSRT
jgi:hypothetical protein